MQQVELATLFEAPSDFQTFGETEQTYFCKLFDVVTEHNNNEMKRAGWPLLLGGVLGGGDRVLERLQ